MKYHAFISYLQDPDKHLAIAIRENLMKLGAKKYRLQRRALEIFRDESNASATGSLTQRIQNGIDNSEYMILLARPEITAPVPEEDKNWIQEELEYWLKTKHNEEFSEGKKIENLRIIICQVDGTLRWDYINKDFLWSGTNCLHEILRSRFAGDPVWVDFRDINAKAMADPHKDKRKYFSLENSDFLQKVAQVSAEIQQKTVDELLAEDRKWQRLWSAILATTAIILVVLTITAVYLAIQSYANLQKAEKEKSNAENNLKAFRIEKFQRDFRNGNIYYVAEEPCFAKDAYADALVIARDYPEDSIVKKNLEQLRLRHDQSVAACR